MQGQTVYMFWLNMHSISRRYFSKTFTEKPALLLETISFREVYHEVYNWKFS